MSEPIADEVAVRECAACHHSISLKGEPNTSQYWQCEESCACLILGCVPTDEKYGTG